MTITSQPNILAIESSGGVCSVALLVQGILVARRDSDAERDHAKVLAPFVQQVLHQGGITAHQLDAVAVSEGPGSYTSLRIGVSLAKGLCYATGTPLIAVSTLHALAWLGWQQVAGRVPEQILLCPMIDARRMEVYTALYQGASLAPLAEVSAQVLEPDSFATQLDQGPVVFVGSGAAKWQQVCKHPNAVWVDAPASAMAIAALAQQAYTQGRFVDVAYFEPFYLKDFVAIKAKNKFF